MKDPDLKHCLFTPFTITVWPAEVSSHLVFYTRLQHQLILVSPWDISLFAGEISIKSAVIHTHNMLPLLRCAGWNSLLQTTINCICHLVMSSPLKPLNRVVQLQAAWLICRQLQEQQIFNLCCFCLFVVYQIHVPHWIAISKFNRILVKFPG